VGGKRGSGEDTQAGAGGELIAIALTVFQVGIFVFLVALVITDEIRARRRR
jgi:hypothetical protein